MDTKQEEWIEWAGGEQPVADDVRVHYRMGDGMVDRGPVSGRDGVAASALRWTHEGDRYTDIIAYRVVSQ